MGAALGTLGQLGIGLLCRPGTNNSMIRTVGLGSIGGQQTQEYLLYGPSSDAKHLTMFHIHGVVQALKVNIGNQLQYVTTYWLVAVVLFQKQKEKAGQLNPYTLDESEQDDEEDAKIYEGAGRVIWSGTGVVSDDNPVQEINFLVKNDPNFMLALDKGSRISLLGSIYTNVVNPEQSLNYESAIIVGKAEFNIMTVEDDDVKLI